MRACSEALAARIARFSSSLALRVSCCAKPAAVRFSSDGHLEALPRPSAQQLPLLLAVGMLAHSGRGAVGVAKDDVRTRVVAACSSADVVRAS
eukprot:1728731-Pleurochrysis_carterae.AAC.1